jgi:hypothetical protein
LHGAVPTGDGGVNYVQEGRLGYEEYAAQGFERWGFDTRAASALEPVAKVSIDGVPILYDARDPAKVGAHNYVVTESFLLSGLEFNWDRADDVDPSDRWTSDRELREMAEKVLKVQTRRYRRTGILTARTEHQLDRPPYFLYDTVFSDGQPWASISDPAGDWFGEAGVEAVARAGGSADQLGRALTAAADAFAEDRPPSDDATALILVRASQAGVRSDRT